MFAVFASQFGSYELSDIRSKANSGQERWHSCFARSEIAAGLHVIERHNALRVIIL
ncbi:conjugal transfer TraA domain protein [Rickettsia hoogstraalii str. RCCE3]|nr:conjugal transfer TraA domain protein [Rickettsia hoogstraalii str. RCCE3]